jgi:hypothetical protein
MKDFKALLLRISVALGSDAHIKASVREAVKECTGGDIKDGDIYLKDGTLSLTASPALKSEIRFKEEKVLACIEEKSGKRISRIVYC